MRDALSVLIADDNPDDRLLVQRELQREFPALTLLEASDEESLAQALAGAGVDVVVTDYQMHWTDGLTVLRQVKTRWPDCPVVMFTATATEEIAVDAMKAGLDDYVLKSPRHVVRLRGVVRTAVDRAAERRRQREAQALIHLQAVALQAAANAIVITDRTGAIQWVNQAFSRLTGYSADEVQGQNPSLLKSGLHTPAFYQQLWQTILAGDTWQGEFINKRKDGSFYTAEQVITPVRDRAGEIVHFIGIKQDITARKGAETALQEHLRLVQLIADVSMSLTQDQPLVAMLRRCTDFLVRHLDAAFARIWTLNPKQQQLELQAGSGEHSHFDLHFNRIPVGQSRLGDIARMRRPYLTNALREEGLLPEEDTALPVGLTAFAGQPLIVADRLIGVLALFSRRPLTAAVTSALAPVADQLALGIERQQHEEALRLSEQRYRYLVETAPDVIVTIAPDGTLTSVNSAFERMFGWPSADWLGKPFLRLVHGDDLSAAVKAFSSVVRGETPPMLAVHCTTRTGDLIDVEVLATPQTLEGKVVGGLFVVRNVTDRKRLEAQYVQAQKMEAVGRLAGGVAHDFNNLLTVINGYAEMLSLQLGEEPRAILEEIRKAGGRAAGLTQRLLAFSRKQVMLPRLLDLNLVITDLEKMLERLIGEDVRLVTDLQPALPPLKADPTCIESIIVNLAVNARDAMPNGGTLTLRTAPRFLDAAGVQSNPNARPGPFILLSVTDSGDGIPPEVLPNIFKPFFTTKAPGKGTGLGLATVHDIVLQSGGVIQLESAPGSGTTFHLYFPLAEDAHLSVPVRSASVELRLRGTETILLVEDDEGVRSLARLILQSRGYTVLEARHGEEAVRLCAQHAEPIQSIVTDLVTPGLSGRQLFERLRQTRPGAKMLCISGYLDDALVQHGILEAGLPFLQKPFSPDALSARVREVLDGP